MERGSEWVTLSLPELLSASQLKIKEIEFGPEANHGLSLFWNCIFHDRQEALRQAERERRKKYKAQDDEREVVRASIREKVFMAFC